MHGTQEVRTSGAQAGETALGAWPVGVPRVYCPIVPVGGVHPQAETVGERSVEWLAGFGIFDGEQSLRQQIVASRVGEAVGRAAPLASDEGLQLYADWSAAAFAFDDFYCDMGPTSTQPDAFLDVAMRVLYRIERPEAARWDQTLLSDAFVDLSRRVRRLAPMMWPTWVTGHQDWFLGSVHGIARRAGAGGRPAGIADHLATRSSDGAMRLNHALIEMTEGSRLPDELRGGPAVGAATAAAYTLVLLANDLISYRREAETGATNTNCVSILTPPGGTVEDGMERVVRLHDRIMSLYIRLSHQLRATGDERLRRYIDQLSTYIRANLDWSMNAPRYHAHNPGATPTSAGAVPCWSAEPLDGSLTAPPIPSIAWWWEQLR
ncbi:terpene synthase family protein [Streptomyces lydicus]